MEFPKAKTFGQEFEELVESFARQGNMTFGEAAESAIWSIRDSVKKRNATPNKSKENNSDE